MNDYEKLTAYLAEQNENKPIDPAEIPFWQAAIEAIKNEIAALLQINRP